MIHHKLRIILLETDTNIGPKGAVINYDRKGVKVQLQGSETFVSKFVGV